MIATFGRLTYLGTTLIDARVCIYGPVCVDRAWRGRGVLRTIFFAPYVLSEVITAVIWQLMLQPDSLTDKILKSLGLGDLVQGWLSDPKIALYTLFVVTARPSARGAQLRLDLHDAGRGRRGDGVMPNRIIPQWRDRDLHSYGACQSRHAGGHRYHERGDGKLYNCGPQSCEQRGRDHDDSDRSPPALDVRPWSLG